MGASRGGKGWLENFVDQRPHNHDGGVDKQQECAADARWGADERWNGGQQSGQVALEDGLGGTGLREKTVTMRTTRRRRTRCCPRSATLFADKNTLQSAKNCEERRVAAMQRHGGAGNEGNNSDNGAATTAATAAAVTPVWSDPIVSGIADFPEPVLATMYRI